MDQIGVRELRQNASVYLRQVEAGKSFEVTVHGRPVAVLSPKRPMTHIEQLIAEGRVKPGKGNLNELGPALPAIPGVPLPSEVLEMMRADER